jgi:hypothetical protein
MRMRCLMCGKRVPFWGEGCPFCGADKSTIQSVRLFAGGMAFVLVVAGYMLLHGWVGFMLGLMVGCAVGLLIDRYGPQLARQLRK